MFQYPPNPVIGQLFTPLAGTTYRWSGTAWYLIQPQVLTQAQADALYVPLLSKGVANGVATLDAGVKIPLAQITLGTANGIATLDAGVKVPQAQLDVARVWATPQRVTPLADNDASFDMNAAQDFTCLIAGPVVITFTNITLGQRGMIRFQNGTNFAVTFAATVKKGATAAVDLSLTGVYELAYWSADGVNVLLTYSEALA